MAENNRWMPFDVGAYLGDTLHLSTVEHGAYLLLLFHYWKTGPLPDEDAVLAAVTKMTLKQWKSHAPRVRGFFSLREDHLHQRRADLEREKVAEISEKRSLAARSRTAIAQQKPSKSPAKNEQLIPHARASVQRTEDKESDRLLLDVPARDPEGREWDQLKTGMADIYPDTATGRPCVNGWMLEVCFDEFLEAAGINPARFAGKWETAVAWLAAGYEPDEITTLIKRISARAGFQAASLKAFDRAVREDLTPKPLFKRQA